MHTVLQRAWCFACIPSQHANEEYSSFVTPLRSAFVSYIRRRSFAPIERSGTICPLRRAGELPGESIVPFWA
jgi:hypothetical protein